MNLPANPSADEIRNPTSSPTLQTCQQLFGSMLDVVPGFFLVFHLADLRLVFTNENARRRLNPSDQPDFLQLTLPELVGLGSWNQLNSEVLPKVQVLSHWTGIVELRDVWGSTFPARITVRTQAIAKGESYLCMYAQEIAETDDQPTAPISDRHLLHALLEHSPDVIYFKDTASRFLRISRSQAKKFGQDNPQAVIGKTDFDFFSAQHASAAFADEQAILRSGQPLIDREEMETWEDGRVTWVTTTKLPLFDATQKLVGTFGISHDITARKQAAEARRELELQLQLSQKLESIGRLAAGVAHEINTPTQFISDNTHFLTDAFAKIETVLAQYRALCMAAGIEGACTAAVAAVVEAEHEAELDYILSEIPHCLQQSIDGLARVAGIVGSLKEFAHPNLPELVPSDLNRAINISVVVSRHEWKYVADLATELDPSLPLVPCVVDEFNQVMLNLIVNSAHAIADALKGRGQSRGKITIRTKSEPQWAIIEVEDTGTGIPPDLIDRIFEPFFTTKAPGKGTGQGLAIARSVIVKHHGGTIDVRTTPGSGATFILRLPLAKAPAPAQLVP